MQMQVQQVEQVWQDSMQEEGKRMQNQKMQRLMNILTRRVHSN